MAQAGGDALLARHWLQAIRLSGVFGVSSWRLFLLSEPLAARLSGWISNSVGNALLAMRLIIDLASFSARGRVPVTLSIGATSDG